MKYLVSLLCTLMLVSASAQNLRSAVEYNNYLIKEQTQLIQKSLEYMSWSVHSEDFAEIEKQRIKLIEDIKYSIRKISKMPDFEGSNKLKNETIDVFNSYLQIYQTDLIEVMGLKKKYKDSYTALEAYLQAEAKVDIKMNKAVEKLGKAQEAFAKKHNLKVQKDGASPIESEVNTISQLSTYSRLVFLEYFKVSWKFNDMVSVLHERDSKSLNKKREDVIETSLEALKTLKSMKRFKNEKDYITQTIDIIDYFLTLSQREFYRVAVLFDKESLTEKEAEYINKVFQDYNANIEVLVYNWNLANQDLWRNHVKPID